MKHSAIALMLCSVWSAGYAYTTDELVKMAVEEKTAIQASSSQPVERFRIESEGVLTETATVEVSSSNDPASSTPVAAPSTGQGMPSTVAPQQPATSQPTPVPTTPGAAKPLQPGSVPQPLPASAVSNAANDYRSQPFKGNGSLAESLYGGGTGNVRQIGEKVPPPGPKAGVASLSLPGVGVMPGDSPELQNNVIRVSSDRTQIVNVSGTLTNRIATPFQKPKAILLDGDASIKAVGQSLYIAPNGNPAPISLYVTGAGTNDPVVSLTLVPKSMPPQTIILQMDGPANPTGAEGYGAALNENTKSDVYTESIVGTLRSLALGKVPQGYAEGVLPKAVANMGSVVAVPLARYSGPFFDVYRYRVEAIVNGTLEMEESAFWTKGVRAVAFYPTGLVARNRPTQVFVIADKSATETGGAR